MNQDKRAGLGAGLALPAFAKINRSLELLGPRPDRYWEIRTLYQTVSLHDRLRLRLTRAHGKVVVRVPGGGAPAGRANLLYRLLARARRLLTLRQGVEVELEKNIPAGRGLGGGSSDAAAALVGLLRLAGIRLSRAELSRLGGAVGADVPLFFLGGSALGVGRGDEVYALEDTRPMPCVLLCPPTPISTRRAYAWAAAQRSARRLTPRRRPAIITGRRWWPARREFVAGGPDQFWAVGNDFESVIFCRFPELARMKAALLRAGAEEAGLSGSGSTVYALFARRADAERAAAWAGVATVYVVETLPRGRYQRALNLAAVLREG
jgi:4-diphosphocytidyl-2-C-methyl-D-erythritol kinase